MAKVHVSKESLEFDVYPAGEYTVQFSGFKPKRSGKDSKNPDGANLNPMLRIVGHPDLSDKPIFFNQLTTANGMAIRELCHCFGVPLDGETPEHIAQGESGEFDIPGDFLNLTDATTVDNGKPLPWQYAGPLLGRTGRLEIAEVQSKDKNNNPIPNQMKNEVKRFFCQIPGCNVKHKENLIRS